MIVIFGASSDIGLRAARCLLDNKLTVRLVARNPASLDYRAQRVSGDISAAAAFAADADTVISCAPARLTSQLLAALPASVRQVVLIGSAWCYSQIPNTSANDVRRAEAAFLTSGRCGVMLHPTMIYGGAQERNLQRLLAVIRRWPVLPLPGGGQHLVQPVYVDDVAACIAAAAQRVWSGASVISVAGPAPMPWREMVLACVRELDCHRVLLPLPLGPAISFLTLIQWAGLKLSLDANMLRRFQEDVNLPIVAMKSELGITPRPFEIGLRQALAEWAQEHRG